MKIQRDNAIWTDRLNFLGFYVSWADWYIKEIQVGFDLLMWSPSVRINFRRVTND